LLRHDSVVLPAATDELRGWIAKADWISQRGQHLIGEVVEPRSSIVRGDETRLA
jgi:hypothetical protein